MFKNLLQFWKGKDFLSQVLGEFREMLSDAKEMFGSVCKKLILNENIPDLEQKIYDVDKRINDLQKDIRKRIVEHLTLRPSVDVSACLLLMSVVKDAERLGDYCKNLLGTISLLEEPLDENKYHKLFNNMDKEIYELFEQTISAFIESDTNKAAEAWSYENRIVKRCDRIIESTAKSNFSVNEAVCFTLIARYFKRLAAHLANIATSVILPINELDYFDEKRREGEGE